MLATNSDLRNVGVFFDFGLKCNLAKRAEKAKKTGTWQATQIEEIPGFGVWIKWGLPDGKNVKAPEPLPANVVLTSFFCAAHKRSQTTLKFSDRSE